jgi:uncharacterized membrane protein YfcA
MLAHLPALLAAAFVAGLVDSVVGGGGLIQTPARFLLLPGASVPEVLGTGKLASLSGTAAAAVTYARKVALDWPVTLPAAALATLFAFLGSRAASQLSREAFRPFVLVMLVVMGAYTLWRKDFGALRHAPVDPRRLPLYGVLIGGGVGLYDGFFGPGAGSILIFLFVGVVGLDFLGASAVAKVVNTLTNLSSLAYFATHGNVLLGVGIPLAACNLAGSVIGARVAVRRGTGFVRVFFLAIVTLLVARIAYDTWRAAAPAQPAGVIVHP